MRAVIRAGILGKLTFCQDYSQPKFDEQKDEGKVLVKIHSAAINPVDYKIPRILGGKVVGFDFCGTVEQVGAGESSSSLKKGDMVFGGCNGSLGEYAIAKTTGIAKVPSSESESEPWKPSELASLHVAYQSALQCLKKGNIINDDGSLIKNNSDNDDKSVLVIGASGGCGIAGIHLCRAVGVKRIIAICSGKNAQLVRDMGATEVVDYTNKEQLEQFFQDNAGVIDCVYDAATNSGGGEDYWDKSIPLLKKDGEGKFTALNGPPSKWTRRLSGREKENESLIMMNSNTADLELIVRLMDKIKAKPLVNVMPFTEDGFHEAFKLLKSRRVKGKIAFDII